MRQGSKIIIILFSAFSILLFTCVLHHGKPGPRPEGVVVTQHIWQPSLHSKLPKPIQYKVNLIAGLGTRCVRMVNVGKLKEEQC